ncbi:MAG: RagB/SusD family nutrient uptake outer membrane protein [Bacteroidetes bacterium]|nr:RagB/SusD family nutrient uptake outer membrane protein [Bacteroidota bacterium]
MRRINTKIITLLVLVSAMLPGCQKFLNEDLLGERSDQQFYKTANDAELALTGIYNVLSFANSDNRIWVFGDVASDDAAKGGIPGDQADIGLIDDFNVSTDNGNLETVWVVYYEGISRANKLLDNIDGINMDVERRNQIKGEAKFLRAYFYYWLVNIYGDIPVHLTTPTTEEMQRAATPVAEVWSLVIIPDLTAAATLLPETFTGKDLGRATSIAAYAFLAKAYLFNEQWSLSEEAAMNVVNSGLHQLALVYKDNFTYATKDNSEVIFAVRHLAGQDPGLGNGMNSWFAPRAQNGYGFDAPTQNFVDEFEKTPTGIYDPRLDYTIGREGQIWLDSNVMFNPDWSPTGYLQKKYIQPLAEVPKENKDQGQLHYIFLRYSDVILMLAEALNEQGNTAQAEQYINMVRQRARESYLYDTNLPGYGTIPDGLLPDISGSSQSSLRDAIRHERRVELGFEFHRYFDIIRYGENYANEAFSDKENFDYSKYKHFPIPQSELNTNFEL